MQPKLKLYTLKFLFSYGNLLTPLGPVIVLTACAIAGSKKKRWRLLNL